MKKLILTAAVLFIVNAVSSQNVNDNIIVNSGFELWVNEDNDEIEPAHWHTITSATGSYAGMVSNQIYKSTITRPGSDGRYSVLIRPRSILGILANGNLTNGRINAGSMKASNHEENYDYTQRDSPDFCTPINNIPDSIVAWVCFRAKYDDSQANFVSVIHDDVDFIYSGPDFSRPKDKICAMSGPHFISRTCDAKSDEYKWKRISVPFVCQNNGSKPCYILILFSTNRLAGEGSSKDELFVDDLELIYNEKK